jgi:hypothetical protein
MKSARRVRRCCKRLSCAEAWNAYLEAISAKKEAVKRTSNAVSSKYVTVNVIR